MKRKRKQTGWGMNSSSGGVGFLFISFFIRAIIIVVSMLVSRTGPPGSPWFRCWSSPPRHRGFAGPFPSPADGVMAAPGRGSWAGDRLTPVCTRRRREVKAWTHSVSGLRLALGIEQEVGEADDQRTRRKSGVGPKIAFHADRAVLACPHMR